MHREIEKIFEEKYWVKLKEIKPQKQKTKQKIIQKDKEGDEPMQDLEEEEEEENDDKPPEPTEGISQRDLNTYLKYIKRKNNKVSRIVW